ncbi:hypothetical protein [Nibricoccus aquaticus]|nr:hypothetical protein [Nibricoccus aquaticus]
MKTIHCFYHAALTGALFCILVGNSFGIGATRFYPQEKKANAQALVASDANGAEGPSTAGITLSGDLDLVTASIFTGGIEVRKRGINALISSSLPAAKTDDADENKYNDAQLMMPTGGVLNVLFVPFASVTVKNWGTVNNGTEIPYGRGELSDRLYLGAKKRSSGDTLTGDQKIAYDSKKSDKERNEYLTQNQDLAGHFQTPEMRCYFFNGIGPKLVSQSSDGAATSKAKNYGLAFTAYAGFGIDGGFTGTANSGSFGNYRLETGVSGNWIDKGSLKKMYPNAVSRQEASSAWIGTFSMVLTGKLQTQIQWAVPLGKSRDYMAKVLLVGVAMNL